MILNPCQYITGQEHRTREGFLKYFDKWSYAKEITYVQSGSGAVIYHGDIIAAAAKGGNSSAAAEGYEIFINYTSMVGWEPGIKQWM